jgi:proton-dependent oligopeptide transporter, POT family
MTTLGFGIFYMVINIGSMTGRTISYFVRTSFGIPAIFTYVATVAALVGLAITLLVYKEPEYQVATDTSTKPKTVGQAIIGMFTVLKNIKFVFFLVVIGFFWFIYVQIYNLIPLYLRFVDKDAPVELYTLINPVMIVCFQLLITKFSKSWTPIKSIIAGVAVTVVGMLLNLAPALLNMDPQSMVHLRILALPIAGVFILVSMASMAVGEMLASPRIYQYIGSIAPKGQEGLYLGYSNLPLALGTIVGAPLGGMMFTSLVKNPASQGLAVQTSLMWIIVASMGVISLVGLYFYDRYMMNK